MNLREVSVIITTCNSAARIVTCLDKVSDFGEIVLVDSFSADGTVEVARRYGAIIYLRPRSTSTDGRNWALGRARHDWVLVLGPDEPPTDDLKSELAGIDSDPGVDGYWMRRERRYLGRRLRHCRGAEDRVLRLFKRSRGRFVESDGGEEIVLHGDTGMLASRLVHDPYDDVERHIRHINERSTRWARDHRLDDARIAAWRMMWRPAFCFARDYLWGRGLLDGSRGVVFCLLSSYDEFLRHAKSWEARLRPDSERTEEDRFPRGGV